MTGLLPTTAALRQDTGERNKRTTPQSVILLSEAVSLILFWLPRLPVSDMSPKPQPPPCDQRKDLPLRRTGETPLAVCVCDGGSHPEVKAMKVGGDFPFQVCCVVVCSV